MDDQQLNSRIYSLLKTIADSRDMHGNGGRRKRGGVKTKGDKLYDAVESIQEEDNRKDTFKRMEPLLGKVAPEEILAHNDNFWDAYNERDGFVDRVKDKVREATLVPHFTQEVRDRENLRQEITPEMEVKISFATDSVSPSEIKKVAFTRELISRILSESPEFHKVVIDSDVPYHRIISSIITSANYEFLEGRVRNKFEALINVIRKAIVDLKKKRL